ncbi:MAG: hypothetical protein GTO40_31290 [Deltaproteobacteria bacterium]|nr:hypothetical protein [Deltaproteobacteria bacterium]
MCEHDWSAKETTEEYAGLPEVPQAQGWSIPHRFVGAALTAAVSLPFVGGAVHAVLHVVAPIFGFPCP